MASASRLSLEVFDEDEALSSVGGDREYLSELFGLTRAALPSLVSAIRQGIEAGDLVIVQSAAHLAKAAARNVSARRTYHSAEQLEALSLMGDLRAARSASESLELEVEILQSVLPFFAADSTAA